MRSSILSGIFILLLCGSVLGDVVMKERNVQVTVREGGMPEIGIGGDVYTLDSAFSCRGERIGWNRFSSQPDGQPSWKPSVRKSGGATVVSAKGSEYALTRRISVKNGRVRIEDTVTNTGEALIGIMVEYRLTGDGMGNALLGGANQGNITFTAENPTVFAVGRGSSLGFIAEDNILRLQMEASRRPEDVLIGARHFALDVGKSHTFKSTLYPLEGRRDYFDFVNLVRQDWKSNFTIHGPMGFFESDDPMLDDPAQLKAHLDKMKLSIIALRPFHAYWVGVELSQDEYRNQMRRAIRILKQTAPDIKVIGCIEYNIVSFDREKLENSSLFDDVCIESGKYPVLLSPEQTAMLEKACPWRDSLVKNSEGRAMFEDCEPKTWIHPMVYSEPGNYQAKHLKEQMRFMIEDVGLDGIYIDQFNLAFEPTQRYHYGKWDGATVDIDPQTGEITRKYTDGGLAGATVRADLINYVLSKNKTFVANTHAAVSETQPLHAFRFMEAGWSSKEVKWKEGEEPALIRELCKGHFDSPIGLGVSSLQISQKEMDEYAEIITRSVIVLLRHALLYYYYSSNMPETGPGSGEYGPIIHMFPITPEELHKGWIKGKERIVTAVSLDTLWAKDGKPTIRVFDIRGREVPGQDRLTVVEESGKWRVRLSLRDWQEVAVIERTFP